MDLLPQTEKEFTDPSYWKRFFEKCDTSFEWYGSYSKLRSVVERYIKPVDAILQIGCGNSTLAEELYDNGFRNVHSIDTDAQVIVKQQNQHSKKRPFLKFEQCSAVNISLPDCSRNVVIDKGTLDALLPPECSSQDLELVDSMFGEIDRCLAPFGRYIIITLAQEHIVRRVISYFGSSRFMVRVQRCDLTDMDFTMPVFGIIVTKFKMELPKRRPFEYVNSFETPTENVDTFEKLMDRISGAQQMNWFRHYISRGAVEEASIKVYAMDGVERYQLTVVNDASLKTLLSYGAFIIPFGREHDWLFATPKGHQILRRNCNLHRLVVVRLSRTQEYGSLDEIQRELNPFILDFMPNTCSVRKINYLSLGTTDVTESVESGCSTISGNWTVEHVRIQEAMFRRLVFLDSSNLVQSEVELRKDKQGHWELDWSNLSCQHHKDMLLAMEFLFAEGATSPLGIVGAMEAELRFAVLGLGGGILAKFLHDNFPKSSVVGVELDRAVYELASRHFEFPEQSPRMEVVICDAMQFLEEVANLDLVDSLKFDVIFVDLSGPVNEEGLYCPPSEFVTTSTMQLMRKCLSSKGVLALNLVTRDESVAEKMKARLQTVYNSVYSSKGVEDINEVIISCQQGPPEESRKRIAGRKRQKKNQTRGGERRRDGKQPLWLKECLESLERVTAFSPSGSN